MYICRRFQKFDRTHHPDCMPAGAWMNLGFSVNRDQSAWEIEFGDCTIEYIGQGACGKSDPNCTRAENVKM